MALPLCGIFPVNNRSLQAALEYPLVKATCNRNVVDVYILTELVQEYTSNAKDQRQITYAFPLPPSAAVCNFKAVIDDKKVINGVVKEKEEAKKMYDSAIAQGKQAGLLEKNHVDLFTVSLVNIKPSQKIVVQRESINAFKLNVSLQMNAPITAVSSPTHPIGMVLGRHSTAENEAHNANLASVSLQDSVFLEKDIVVVVSARNLDHPRCVAEKWLAGDGAEETTHAYALTMVPKFDLPPIKSQEYIFLVDRSGSMGGQRIESVKIALQIMLRSLPSRKTTFNIVSFGSRTSSLWPKSEPYNEASVDRASKRVETIDADYGVTELASALNVAYGSKTRSHPEVEPSTVVFILTDGDSWDLRGVVDQVSSSTKSAKESSHLLRTFVLGVGDSVAVGMCENIARAGQGIAVFVGKPNSSAFYALPVGGVVDNVTVDWGISGNDHPDSEQFELVERNETGGGIKAQQPVINLYDPTSEPAKEPETGPKEVVLPPHAAIQQAPKSSSLSFPIYPEFRCNIFAIIKQKADSTPFSSIVKIRGEVLGIPVVLDVPVQSAPTFSAGGHLLHTLASRALIEDLEDEKTSPTAKAEIKRLGIRYHLATSATSFVAIEEENSEVLALEEPAVIQHEEADMDSEEDDSEDMAFGIFDDGPGIPPAAPVSLMLGFAPTRLSRKVAVGFGYESGESEEGNVGFPLVGGAGAPPKPSIAPAPPRPSVAAAPVMRSFAAMSSGPMPHTSTSGPSSILSMPPVGATDPASAPKPVEPTVLTLSTLAQAQSFNGAFENNPSTISLLLNGQTLPAVPPVLEAASLGAEDKVTIWVTILALTVMQKKFGTDEERAAWSLLAEKATEFVCSVLVDAGLTNQAADKILEACKEEALKFV